MQLQLPATTTRHEHVPLGGGLDQLTPILELKPGVVRDALNWEQSITGGYTRIGGYERYDGRALPSSALYFTLTCVVIAPIAVGATIIGLSSGASGLVLSLDTSTSDFATVIAYTQAAGAFIEGEDLRVGGTTVATSYTAGGTGAADDYDVSQRALAADVYRVPILAVPGSGRVRGGFFYGGSNYAFRDNLAATALLMYRATGAGWVLVATPALLPGGRVQTDYGNFDGTTRVYGCDSVNKGFVFNGATLSFITTGNVPDVPDNVLVHSDHLWFSFGDNVQNSAIADPLLWTAIAGSASFRVRAPITSLQRQPGSQAGGAMSVATESGTEMIYGSSAADFQKVPFEESAGARKFGGQRLGGQTIMFGSIGVFSLSATQAFGNFTPASMTMKIRPFTQTRRDQTNASLVNREKSQYRVFFNDGFGLYMTILNGKLVGSMPVSFPNKVTCAWQGEAVDGAEAAYFGSDNGMVYRLDSGTSFDGAAIPSYFTLAFSNQRDVRSLKRYRRATFEIQGDTFAEFAVTYEVNYGAGDRPQGDVAMPSSIALSSVYWDAFTWDNFIWDGKTLAPSTIELRGTGENIALRVDSSSEKFASFTLNSVVIDYTMRRLMRTNQ